MQEIYDHIFGDGFSSSGGGDIDDGGSGSGSGTVSIAATYTLDYSNRFNAERYSYSVNGSWTGVRPDNHGNGLVFHANVTQEVMDAASVYLDTHPYVCVWSAFPGNITYFYGGRSYSNYCNITVSTSPWYVDSGGLKNDGDVYTWYDAKNVYFDSVTTVTIDTFKNHHEPQSGRVFASPRGDGWAYIVQISEPEPEPPAVDTHEHPTYGPDLDLPDGSGGTYTYNVYNGDDVAYTIEVEGTDLSPITLRLDDLNLMFSDFANEFSWFEDTLLSLLMRIFTMQLYIYDEIADLLDGLETLDHSTDDLADLSTVERYLEDILSAVTNFADEDTGVTLMRGYLKGIFDDFGQLLQLLGDWPEYPTVEPTTVTVEPTDLDPVLTELRKIEDLLKGTGVKAPVADPDESDPEKTIGMRIGEKMDELKDRFPFSLPWDIFAILNLLRADSVAPQFDLPVFGSEESVHVDLSVWESVAVVTRGGTTILFALGLALRSRSLLASWGGVSGD